MKRVCMSADQSLAQSLPDGIFMFFPQATMTREFSFSSCLVTNIGKSYCGWLPFPPTIPVAGTIYVTPYLNNNLLLVIFNGEQLAWFLSDNIHQCCWSEESVGNSYCCWITALLRMRRRKEHEVAPNTTPLTVRLLHPPWNSSPLHSYSVT